MLLIAVCRKLNVITVDGFNFANPKVQALCMPNVYSH